MSTSLTTFAPRAAVPPTNVTAGLSAAVDGRAGWSFDASTQQAIIVGDYVLPSTVSSLTSLTFNTFITPASAGGSNGAVFGFQVEPLGTVNTDVSSDHFLTVAKATITLGSANIAVALSVTLSGSSITGLAAGVPFRIIMTRFPGDAGDTSAAIANWLEALELLFA